MPEFQRGVLEALRQPIESGEVTVARANLHVTYPARFQLVAAMNPCRCGHLANPAIACTKAPRCAHDYQARISGPLLDRFDLHVDVPALAPDELDLPAPAEGNAEVAARVAAVRGVQADRLVAAGAAKLRLNAETDGELLEQIAPLEPGARALLKRAAERLHLSARGWNRIIRVARTIADLDGAAVIGKPHIAEAIGYRRRLPGRE
jgi:magnesium chelatase family protein